VKSTALHIAAGSIRLYSDSQNLNIITKSLHLHNVTKCSMYHQEEEKKKGGKGEQTAKCFARSSYIFRNYQY
jgi:hypothetical protein